VSYQRQRCWRLQFISHSSYGYSLDIATYGKWRWRRLLHDVINKLKRQHDAFAYRMSKMRVAPRRIHGRIVLSIGYVKHRLNSDRPGMVLRRPVLRGSGKERIQSAIKIVAGYILCRGKSRNQSPMRHWDGVLRVTA
jgi:hypothetical protein